MTRVLERVTALREGWQLQSCAPGQWQSPSDLPRAPDTHAIAAVVPSTVASSLRAAGHTTTGDARLDARDYWYRRSFNVDASGALCRALRFDGLATLAEAWLDGVCILRSDNMFVAHQCDVTDALRDAGDHELCLRFSALQPVLHARRPRGGWPARLVSEKNLRFVRTSLLGYMPGWYPRTPVIGPWRGVSLVESDAAVVESAHVRATVDGDAGRLDVALTLTSAQGCDVRAARLKVPGLGEASLQVSRQADAWRVHGELRASHVERWWPHTHGASRLYIAEVVIETAAGTLTHALSAVGFRDVVAERGADGTGFGLRINGRDVFCRGACWSPLDVDAVHGGRDAYRHALQQVRDAGLNMLRVSGITAYEADDFYALCDELGIMVWQDFMFANFDYPTDDETFVAGCRQEAVQVCDRLGTHACLSVLCGGSEVQQQAAMMGAPAAQWHSAFFDQLLPQVCDERGVNVPYVPSSPSGGALPFHVNAGVGHYYGVGAYLRPLDDVRIANVRFASECLAFSNVPEADNLRLLGDFAATPHAPQFKAGVPRDASVGWDFADVTDHYVEQLFDVDARMERYRDAARYLELCRFASGAALAHVMQHLRLRDSGCAGALVWLLRDPMPGAGWGIIDSTGAPKAAYYFLKRAWAPRAMWLSDEGVNGLLLHIDNATAHALHGEVEVMLCRDDGSVVERATRPVQLDAFAQMRVNVEAILGRFADASYAYRFGPPGHRVVAARWIQAADNESDGVAAQGLADAFHVIDAAHVPPSDLGLVARATIAGDVSQLVLQTRGFAQGVHIEIAGCEPSDNFFHLAPGQERRIQLRWRNPPSLPHGLVRALNGLSSTSIVFTKA